MTPIQFAAEQCANYDRDGSRKGVGIKPDGSLFSFGSLPRCVLAIPGVRCVYFEDCVAPMGFEDPKRRAERDEAVKLYRLETNTPKLGHQTGRVCPICKVRQLEARRRLAILEMLKHEIPIDSEDPEVFTISKALGKAEKTIRLQRNQALKKLSEILTKGEI